MALVLVGTSSGLRAFADSGEAETELPGHAIGAVTAESGGGCLAVVDGQEIWRRDLAGAWSQVAATGLLLQSIVSVQGAIFAGAMDEATVLRISVTGEVERLASFDQVAGREQWFAGGPPLGVRSLTATADGAVVLAGVHVGGIPVSSDKGKSWTPTIPVNFDVHEVRAHASLPNMVAAATAVGLCVSRDRGSTWKALSEGLEITYSLAVCVLADEVLFSISDGHFAKRSQIWRWRFGGEHLETVADGLPEWLEGKVDTGGIAAGAGRVAVLDVGGNLWLSSAGSTGWQRIATGLPYSFGILIV